MNLFKVKNGFSIEGGASILRGTASPNVYPGISAPISSLYLRDTGSSGELWQKTGNSDIEWTKISSDVTLEDFYQNNFLGKTNGNVMPSYGSSPSVVDNGDSIQTAISKLDNKIGEDLVPVNRINNKLVSTDSLHSNLSKIDNLIGGNLTSNNYVNNSNSINGNLSALDIAVKNNSDAIAAIQTGQRWIAAVRFVTTENLTSRSGLAHFSDDDAPFVYPNDGDRVVSTYDNKIYIASSGVWSSGTPLVAGDTFFTENDLTNTSSYHERGSAYTFNGTTLIRQASFDFELADSISLSSVYSANHGLVSPGDSVEKAISNLDGNNNRLTQAVGVSSGDNNLGVWVGTGANRLFVNGSESAKTALQKVANDIGGSAGGAGDYLSNQSVNSNLNVVDSILTEVLKKISISNIPSSTEYIIDTIDFSNGIWFVDWDVVLVSANNTSHRYMSKIRAMVTSSGSDVTEYSILNVGNSITNVQFSIDSSVLSSVKLKIQCVVSGGYHVKLFRRIGNMA